MSFNQILSSASPAQLLELMNASDYEVEKLFLKLASTPSNGVKNIVSAINDALSPEGFVAQHASFGSTNASVDLPQVLKGVAKISILSMYGRYELALIDESGLLSYNPSIGYSDYLPSFDTPNDVIAEIKRIYNELNELQKL